MLGLINGSAISMGSLACTYEYVHIDAHAPAISTCNSVLELLQFANHFPSSQYIIISLHMYNENDTQYEAMRYTRAVHNEQRVQTSSLQPVCTSLSAVHSE